MFSTFKFDSHKLLLILLCYLHSAIKFSKIWDFGLTLAGNERLDSARIELVRIIYIKFLINQMKLAFIDNIFLY